MQSIPSHFVLYPPSYTPAPLPTPSASFSKNCESQVVRSRRRRSLLGRDNLPSRNCVLPLQASAKPFYVQQRQDEDDENGSSSTISSRVRQTSRPRSRVTYTVQDEGEPVEDIAAPLAPGAKTLKINIDLLLWRSRQSRLVARLTLDAEKRKSLMRSAEEGLRRCLDLDPGDGRTYVVLGKLLTMNKRYDEARKLYTEGCQNTGNTNPFIWSAWGWLEFKTGNIERARKLFDAATVVSPTHAAAWHKWGFMEKSEGKYARARDLWLKGISMCKQQSSMKVAYLYNALACMSAQLGNTREARFWFREGTSHMSGKNATALWQAWCVLEARVQELGPNQMRQLFRKSVECNPRSRYVHLSWALWEKEQGNLDLCIALQRRGLQFNPTDAALYSNLAIVMWRDCGDVVAARELFEAGVCANPGDLYVWQAWGYMEGFHLGNVSRARELFQQGVWADPRNPNTAVILQAWGMLERRTENYQLARELFKAAVKVDPKNEKAWGSWIVMERDLGFTERADELEIKLNENRWEFEVPAGFSTRTDSSPATALARVTDMLRRFFTIRGDGKGSASPEGPGAPTTTTTAPSYQPVGPAQPNTLTNAPPDSLLSATLPSTAYASSSGSGSGQAAGSGSLQLEDVLPRSVQEAQDAELRQERQQQQQQLLRSYAPPAPSEPSAASPAPPGPPPAAAQLQGSVVSLQPQPQRPAAPTPASIMSAAPPPSLTTTSALSSPERQRAQPGPFADAADAPSEAAPPPSGGAATSSTSTSAGTSTSSSSLEASKLGPAWVGSKAGAGVARPTRDAALTAAGRQVELPIEQALQELVGAGTSSLSSMDGGEGAAASASSSSSSSNGSGTASTGGSNHKGHANSNGNGMAPAAGSAPGAKIGPPRAAGQEAQGAVVGQGVEKSVGQQLLELMGEEDGRGLGR